MESKWVQNTDVADRRLWPNLINIIDFIYKNSNKKWAQNTDVADRRLWPNLINIIHFIYKNSNKNNFNLS